MQTTDKHGQKSEALGDAGFSSAHLRTSHSFFPKTKLFTSLVVVFWDVCYNLYFKS
jgi:hypothetical protein